MTKWAWRFNLSALAITSAIIGFRFAREEWGWLFLSMFLVIAQLVWLSRLITDLVPKQVENTN